jgi:tetratricopeptide (TPR) repeat protein
MNHLFEFPRRLALAALLICLAPPIAAQSLKDVRELMKQGQNAQALEQLNAYVSANPKDAQGRFLKGVVLTELKRTGEALAVFAKMTEDYPELPEPYNNMAVIYAQQNQYDKARQALEMAIRTHPSYATAHENLGDIYARLASQAYDKALQLDSSNASAKNKLALIHNLVTTVPVKTKSAQPAPTETPVDVVKPPVAPPNPPSASPPEVKPTPTEATPAANEAEVRVITQAIDAWAGAWSRKDMSAYLAAYAKTFAPPGGQSRTAWEAERRKRILKPGNIKVSYENLTITVADDSATARFRQNYASGGFKSAASKTLQLMKQNGRWLIQQERVGN